MPPKSPSLLELQGQAAPPRANGELVFEAPWEREVFGIAMALHERGVFTWDDFRALLIEEIASGQRGYYEHWSRALERLLVAKGLVTALELEGRVEELAARPAGHDHDHRHDHDRDSEGEK